jgi:hypothetical protein
MKSWLGPFALLATTIVLNACGGIPVSTDYDPDWQLQQPATYAWMDRPQKAVVDPLIDNDLVERRVHRAVAEQLEGKGLREGTAANATVLVTYHVGEEEKLDISSFHSNFGYYPCWRCYGPGFDSDVWVSQYTQGKLVIDLIDAKTKQLVWRSRNRDRDFPEISAALSAA